MGTTMIKKGYGRIYVADKTKVQDVLDIIKEIDQSEFDGYYVKDLVVPYEGDVKLIYTHKFEIDTDLLNALCWKRGILIWIITKSHEYTSDFDISKFMLPICPNCREHAKIKDGNTLCDKCVSELYDENK